MLSANEIILLGQVGDAERSSAEWQGVALQWERRAEELRHLLDVESAHAEGLRAKMRAVVEALRRVDPKNGLFERTGAFFDDGRAEDAAARIYAETFDTKLSAAGHEHPTRFRQVAMTPQQRRDANTPKGMLAAIAAWRTSGRPR